MVLALDTNLTCYTTAEKNLKTKSQKVVGTNSYFCRSYKGETGGEECGGFLTPTPILNRVDC